MRELAEYYIRDTIDDAETFLQHYDYEYSEYALIFSEMVLHAVPENVQN